MTSIDTCQNGATCNVSSPAGPPVTAGGSDYPGVGVWGVPRGKTGVTQIISHPAVCIQTVLKCRRQWKRQIVVDGEKRQKWAKKKNLYLLFFRSISLYFSSIGSLYFLFISFLFVFFPINQPPKRTLIVLKLKVTLWIVAAVFYFFFKLCHWRR